MRSGFVFVKLVHYIGSLLIAPGLLLGQSSDPGKAHQDSASAERILHAAISEGRAIFHGTGTCFGCHGGKLEGSQIGPTLLAHQWKNGDGSLAAIIRIVSNGVPNTAMVAHPGGINDAQVVKVATYVWAVSHGKAAL